MYRVCNVLDYFFFKQKTSYEMRIGNWISDVCSSDLVPTTKSTWSATPASSKTPRPCSPKKPMPCASSTSTIAPCFLATARSEEHTSELQSLMRISYAVFCLKKKNKKQVQSTKSSNQKPTMY